MQGIDTIVSFAIDPSADWSPSTDITGFTWSVAFDKPLLIPADFKVIEKARWTVSAPPAWARSSTNAPGSYKAGSPTGMVCDLTMAPCVSGSLAAPVPPPGGGAVRRWRGRPSLAADRVGNVVTALLYDKDGDPAAEGVALAVSHDGGRTVDAIVDATPTGVGDDCEKGKQDSPHVTWDRTTAPYTAWVGWKNKDHDGCVEPFRFVPSMGGMPVLTPFGAAHKVKNIDTDHGSLKVGAMDGMVTVVYQHVDSVADCSDTKVDKMGRIDLTPTLATARWESVSSFDGGSSWTDSVQILKTDDFQWCSMKSTTSMPPVPSGVQRSTSEFDFLIAPDGKAYVAVNGAHDRSFLFMSPTRGIKPGASSLESSWWLSCPTPTSPDYPWFVPGVGIPKKFELHRKDNPPLFTCGPAPEPFQSIGGTAFHPTLAASGNSDILLFQYESAAGDATLSVVGYGSVVPRANGIPSGANNTLDHSGRFQRLAVPGSPTNVLTAAFFDTTSMGAGSNYSYGASLALAPWGTFQAPICNLIPTGGTILATSEFTPYWIAPDRMGIHSLFYVTSELSPP